MQDAPSEEDGEDPDLPVDCDGYVQHLHRRLRALALLDPKLAEPGLRLVGLTERALQEGRDLYLPAAEESLLAAARALGLLAGGED